MLWKRVCQSLIFALMISVPIIDAAGAVTDQERENAVRVSPAYAHQEVVSGKSLLVCAYPDVEVCNKVMLKGAISLKELERRLPELKKNQEIIFYCA